jgi:hypothetical protein
LLLEIGLGRIDCHAEGRGFESHQPLSKRLQIATFDVRDRPKSRTANHAEDLWFEHASITRMTTAITRRPRTVRAHNPTPVTSSVPE